MSRRILLLYNTPKAKRYFNALVDGIKDMDVRTGAIAVSSGPGLENERYQQMAAYTMQRKRARRRIPSWRLRLLQSAHQRFAHWHYHSAASKIARYQPDAIAVWGGQSVDTRAALAAAEDAGIPSYIFECGLLPNTTTCDPRGVNFDNSLPRYPAFYQRFEHATGRDLPEHLVPRQSKRQCNAVALPETYIFVPFQVRLDSQVLCYSPWIRSMPQLFETVLSAAKQSQTDSRFKLVFKQHPSCRQQYPELQTMAEQHSNVIFANGNSTESLIRNARGVITVNSTVGIEALLLKRPVLTLGQACYAIDGVCDRATSIAQISHWLDKLKTEVAPHYPMRAAFLNYLAHVYCIPGSHKVVSDEHLQAISRRLASHPQPARIAITPDAGLTI